MHEPYMLTLVDIHTHLIEWLLISFLFYVCYRRVITQPYDMFIQRYQYVREYSRRLYTCWLFVTTICICYSHIHEQHHMDHICQRLLVLIRTQSCIWYVIAYSFYRINAYCVLVFFVTNMDFQQAYTCSFLFPCLTCIYFCFVLFLFSFVNRYNYSH
jgi:hypothetical protein